MATKAVVKKAASKGTAMVAWKDKLAAMAGAAKEIEDSVQLNNWISTAGGKLSFMGSPLKNDEMSVVILTHLLENSYFDEDYDKDNPKSPVCFAFGIKNETLKPHADSEKPQHSDCKTCKWNVFGTADKGKGKACKNIRRMAMIHSDSLKKGAEGIAGAPLALLKLPVTSGKGWAGYVQQLANVLQRPPLAVITNIKRVPDDDSQFKIVFEHVADIDDPELLDALMAREEDAKKALEAPYQANAAEDTKAPAKKAAAKKAGRKY